MFRNIPVSINLWRHQRSALTFVIKHLRSSDDPCLIRMPTGTGKTGVIACLSLISADGRTLVLTPWSNLRDQLIDALKQDFWKSIGAKVPAAGLVVGMTPSTAETVCKNTAIKVVVCTFSTLTELRRTKRTLYDQFASFIDNVIVDECHYEPAVEWGKAVKGLQKPTVLLTATPYRNDLKLFRIRDVKAAVYQFTHEEAESKGIVRSLRSRPLNVQPSTKFPIEDLTHQFISIWEAENKGDHLISQSPRAIICCANAADIRQVVAILHTAGLDAIGIHETFESTTTPGLKKDVPATNISASIWVHQNKLTEGLDDHRFCCLAFFCPINNDRKLIQQIGRILRTNQNDRKNAAALMLAPPAYKLDERWNAYRDFERDVDLLSPERYRRFVEHMLEEQPPIEYFNGRFRRRFQTSILSSDPQVLIAPSVLVREVQQGFTMHEYIEDCTDTLNLTDAIILGEPNQPCQQSSDFALWVYVSIGNSRLLRDTSLYELRLEAHCAVLAGGYLLVSDTTGTYPENLLDTSTASLSAAQLSRLFDATYRLTNVSVTSAVPFDTVLRASEHRAHDLASIPASLTDRIQICRSARGASTGNRRYLGLHRGRVREELSEQVRQHYSATVFKDWAKAITTSLAATGGDHPVLQRYMQTVIPPVAPVPVSVSIDLSDTETLVTTSLGEALHISSSSVSVSAKGPTTTPAYECLFTFLVKNDPSRQVHVKLTLEYQQSKQRFWFKSSGTTGVSVQDSTYSLGANRNFSEYLNHNQELVLVGLQGGELVYQGRNFYAIDYKRAEQTLLQHFSTTTFAPCGTEKGTEAEVANAKRCKATSFIPGSLFKVIAEKDLGLGFSPDLIICDDLGSECADFVLANFTNKNIALVHAKAGKGTGISASAFHDVVAQAMKNLAYLTRNAEKPDGVSSSWKVSSLWNNTGIPRLYKLPAGYPTATTLWKKLRDEIIDAANAQLHVVLVTTGCCDLPTLRDAVRDPTKRTAETAQLLHLLDGLVGYARQLGVRVTVIDVPFLRPPKPAASAKKSVTPAKTASAAKKKALPAKTMSTVKNRA